MASAGYRIAAIRARDVPRYIIPVQVTGPVSFLLLAVWSQKDPDFSYVRGVIRAVDCYRDLIGAQPTVVAGDFNSNAIWDYKRPAGQNHSGLVRNLAELGLVSAYHFLTRRSERYCGIKVPWSARHVASTLPRPTGTMDAGSPSVTTRAPSQR